LFVGLFTSIKYIVTPTKTKKQSQDKVVCVSLTCLEVKKEHTHKQDVKKPIEKKVEKRIEKPKKVLKKVEKKEIKKQPIPKKKQIIKKKVIHHKKVETKPKKIQKPKQQIDTVEKKVVKNIKPTPIKTEPKKIDTSTDTAVVKKQQTKKSIHNNYINNNLALIQKMLQENLYYPRRARKKGIEGDVLVSFVLSTSAKIESIKVLSSSHEILSRGAIKTIEELSGKFPKPSEELNIKIPITYRLR
jgi:protein TonB